VGWYFTPELYDILEEVNELYPVFIVANRYNDLLKRFNHHVRENTGLDWGAYSYYLKNVWDHESPVLFQHDDVRVSDAGVYDELANLKKDFCYIFRDREELEVNRGVHGRGFYCSKECLRLVLAKYGGWWYDPDNRGNTLRSHPEQGMHYNAGVCKFVEVMTQVTERFGLKYGTKIIPGFSAARRGEWEDGE
jgi:hypothetical protein